MFDILTLNKIAACGLDKFDADKYKVSDTCADPDGIVLRSFSMHEMELGANLKAVARAGAGVNNIPIDACTEKGIVVFNTPGANANAVKELVIAGLLLSSRNIVGGIEWAKTLLGKGAEVGKLVEKGKSQFVGPEIKGKTLGIIGLGAIGVMVANAAHSLGMDVIGYDPYMTIDAAWHLSRSIKKATDINDIYANCDYITLHVPANDSTTGMINSETLAKMKDGVRILNFARGTLVNEAHMAVALEEGKVASYVVDFPSDAVLSMDNVIAIPHLGASTPESEDNCAMMAADELKDYLENGNITNSVNFPNCEMAREGESRITIAHKNVPTMLSQFSALVAEKGLNILHMLNKSKKENAYTIMDIDSDVADSIADELSAIDGVLGVRIIR
ncbi:MAG: phosphoglycerate dehydrogenase [Clostridia bacterium]|nr:phosphoglycerate dehydrogenase [Clostridia bacterium]MBQ3553414.1 phosphoglycerate dehydrogenase [Clostridia bacterium]